VKTSNPGIDRSAKQLRCLVPAALRAAAPGHAEPLGVTAPKCQLRIIGQKSCDLLKRRWAMNTNSDNSGDSLGRRRFLAETSALTVVSMLGLPRRARAEPPVETTNEHAPEFRTP
jgi:hypothetical protein